MTWPTPRRSPRCGIPFRSRPAGSRRCCDAVPGRQPQQREHRADPCGGGRGPDASPERTDNLFFQGGGGYEIPVGPEKKTSKGPQDVHDKKRTHKRKKEALSRRTMHYWPPGKTKRTVSSKQGDGPRRNDDGRSSFPNAGGSSVSGRTHRPSPREKPGGGTARRKPDMQASEYYHTFPVSTMIIFIIDCFHEGPFRTILWKRALFSTKNSNLQVY